MSEASVARVASRFAQIGYTSGRGGFGIHSEVGEPTASERDLLVRGADPERTDFGQPLPRFAAPGEVARFNRNLVFTPAGEGVAATWHTAPAGADESGRAGNVFVHAYIDREASRGGDRVIDSWRSPDWATPYGAPEVRACTLPARPPGAGDVVGTRRVCDFLLDLSSWRLGMLSRLLDELAEPRGARGPLVLGVESPDRGALWIGAIAHLMSPGAAALLGFGVWETARLLQSERASRLDFVCMPEAEVPAVRERFPQLTALLEMDDIALQEANPEAHDGAEVWGALAVGMFSLAADPEAVLREVDVLAQRVGDEGIARPWPLAMAMARRLDSWDFLSLPIAAALRASSPPQLSDHPDLLDETVALVARHTGESAADAWTALQATAAGPIGAVLQRIYVGRAVADDAWLNQSGGAPGRRDPTWNPAAHQALSDDITRALDRIHKVADPIDRAVTLTNLADLLVRGGWPTEDPDAVCNGRLLSSLDRALRPVLADHDGRSALTAMTHVSDTTRRDLLRTALADWPLDIARQARVAIGRRTPPDVLAWLYAGDSLLSIRSDQPTMLDVEALAWAALGGADEALTEKARHRLLDHALSLTGPDDADDQSELLNVISASRPLRAGEVLRLLACGIRASDAHVAAAILGAETNEQADVLDLLEQLASVGDRPAVDNAIQILLLLRRQAAWGAPSFEVAVDRYAPKALSVFGALGNLARRPAGSLWAGHLAAAVELTNMRSDEHGVLVLLRQGLSPDAADLFASLLSLPMTEPRAHAQLAMIAARAMACDSDFPRTLPPNSPPMVTHGLLDIDGRPALTSGLERYYAALDKESLTACRDDLLAEVEALFGEDPGITDFARIWFGRMSGNRSVGDRLRNVGGRIFGR